jgi:hypothetical protein
MRKFGRTEIWTNKYKTCRTVKCYAGKRDAEMEKSIAKKLGAAGVKFDIKIIPGYAIWARDSFIVTVPLV